MPIKVYSTKWCTYCKMTKDFLRNNKIKFQEVDVQEDAKAAQDMIQKSGQTGVPVIEINRKIIIGFDRSEIKKALRLK